MTKSSASLLQISTSRKHSYFRAKAAGDQFQTVNWKLVHFEVRLRVFGIFFFKSRKYFPFLGNYPLILAGAEFAA